MTKENKIVFIVRFVVFAGVVFAYFSVDDLAAVVENTPVLGGLTPVHLVWLVFVAGMAFQLFPNSKTGMGGGKQFARNYQAPREEYDRDRLRRTLAGMNEGAKSVLRFWLGLAGMWAALYYGGFLGRSELLLVVMVYYLCDSFCMLFWCPLQQVFMKSRCCANCRIYGWGHFLVCGLLVFLPGFFTWSLALLSLGLMIRWEAALLWHPERFWSGSNATLRCNNCTEKACQRDKLPGRFRRIHSDSQ